MKDGQSIDNCRVFFPPHVHLITKKFLNNIVNFELELFDSLWCEDLSLNDSFEDCKESRGGCVLPTLLECEGLSTL